MALAGRFATTPYFIRMIFIDASEGLIAEHLNQCLSIYPELLQIVSPDRRQQLSGQTDARIKECVDYLQKAFDHLMGLLPKDAVVKVE